MKRSLVGGWFRVPIKKAAPSDVASRPPSSSPTRQPSLQHPPSLSVVSPIRERDGPGLPVGAKHHHHHQPQQSNEGEEKENGPGVRACVQTSASSKPPVKRFIPPMEGGAPLRPLGLCSASAGPSNAGSAAAASSSAGGSEAKSVRRFEAIFCKQSMRKKKVYNEGVLTVEQWQGNNRRLVLESEEGKVEARKVMYGNDMSMIREGTSMKIGNFDVEVGAPKGGDSDTMISSAATTTSISSNAGSTISAAARGTGSKSSFGGGSSSSSSNLSGSSSFGGVSSSNRFMIKPKAMTPLQCGLHNQSSGPPHPQLPPRVLKEGELLLFDPALERPPTTFRSTTLGGRSGGHYNSHLHQPPPAQAANGAALRAVVVEAFLGKQLRPHQQEAVRFLWRRLTGRLATNWQHRGCILADEMGLGKTLTAITLMYTLTKQGPVSGAPDVQKVVVVCPSSLVGQWGQEFKKWLQFRLRYTMVDGVLGKATGKGGSADQIREFASSSAASSTVLIISYEGYRYNAQIINDCTEIGLIVCDEGHRLKSTEGGKTIMALSACPAKARLLMTGTPIQNELEEFFALCQFVNPEAIGTVENFRANFSRPIMKGRDPKASQTTKEYGMRQSKELMKIISKFFIRRTASDVLRKLIPPKTDLVIFCRPCPLQRRLHETCLKVGVNIAFEEGNTMALKLIDTLRKVCNHPRLLFPDLVDARDISEEKVTTMLKTTKASLKEEEETAAGGEGIASAGSKRRGGGKKQKKKPSNRRSWTEGGGENGGGAAAGEGGVDYACAMSSKLQVLEDLLEVIYQQTNDRVVLVSNFTTTLDVLESSIKKRKWRCLRLDGNVEITNRQSLVDAFNKPSPPGSGISRHTDDPYIFLLSSRAGGAGLNLVGGNRLILFDSHWNPSSDCQVKSRVWRDGQKKKVVIYRLLLTGTVEEKIYQRQLSKRELHNTVVEDTRHEIRNFSQHDLKKLFYLTSERTRCETYDLLRAQAAAAGSSDVGTWTDYQGPMSIKCLLLREVANRAASAVVGSSCSGYVSTAQLPIISFVHHEKDDGDEEEEVKEGDAEEGIAADASTSAADVDEAELLEDPLGGGEDEGGGGEKEEEKRGEGGGSSRTGKRRRNVVDDDEGSCGEAEWGAEEGGGGKVVIKQEKVEEGAKKEGAAGAVEGMEMVEADEAEEEAWQAIMG